MNIKKEILEWIGCIVIAIILALLFRYYIGTPTIVKSVSMKPTLVEGQRLILNRMGRTLKKLPERGEIITFEAPTKKYHDMNSENVIAEYSNYNSNWFEYFKYYILEISKESYIKRVIALPGEHVEIYDGKVYIDGKELEEDYLPSGTITTIERDEYMDFIVPENCVFAMGDNRSQSTDCRKFGCIPLEKIEGKVLIRFWPFDLFGKVK